MIMREWAKALLQSLALGKTDYRINGMYIEYENVADPDEAIDPPDFSEDDSIEYYRNLADPRDFLRVPLWSTPALSVASGDEALFDGEGVNFNQGEFCAYTSGTSGFNGRDFSAAVKSKVFGIGLVVVPDWDDQTKDILVLRDYYTSDKQIVKSANRQIGVSFRQKF